LKSYTPILIATVMLATGWAFAQTVEEDQAALAKAKAASAAAEKRAAALEIQAEAETDAAQQYLSRSAAIAARIQSAEADIDAADARIKVIEKMRADQREVLARKQEPAVRLMAALQMMARRPPSVALVQPTSIQDVVHVRASLDSMLPVLRQRTAGLRADLVRGRELRADADKALAALNASKAKLAVQRGQLTQLAEQRRSAARKLAGSAMVEQDRAIAMSEKARDLTDLLETMAGQAERANELASLPGPVLRPVQPGAPRADPVDSGASRTVLAGYRLPVMGRIVQGTGEILTAATRSNGITIATRPSAQVVAPAGGRIAFAGVYRSYGRIAIIDHGQGWTTLVTNLAALDVAVGDDVVAGSPLGRAGPERPTITLELRDGSTPVDISRYLG
jgi:septal ring factor EnvC (AmiA/AmiB activator)